MRKKRICVVALFVILVISFVVAGCNKKNAQNYTLPETTEIEVGTQYVPDFKLAKGTTAEVVSFETPIDSDAKVAEDGSFTPDVTGKYDYTVRFTKKKNVQTEKITFEAVDRTAPVFGAIADKNDVEIGFYTDIPADIEGVSVTDNCAEKVTVYAKSIAIGETVTPIARDGAGLFLPKVGKYTVTLVAEDFSGNKTEGTYNINTVDTTSAVLEAPKIFITWRDAEGKAEIPKINVIEIGDYSLTAEVKQGSEPITVESGKFVAEEDAVYTVTYKATDASDNKSELTVKLRVNSAGKIADFTDPDEIELFADEAARAQDGAMYFYSDKNTVTSEFFDYFLTSDWSAFKTFGVKVSNNRAVDLNVKAHIRTGGEWKEIAPFKLGGGQIYNYTFIEPTTGTYKFSLADYSLSRAEGIRFTLASRGGVDAAIDDIILTDEELSSTLPGDAISLKPLSKGEIDITDVTPTDINDNAVKLTLNSSVQADMLIGLKFDALTLYARRTVNAGTNNIIRIAAAELGSGADVSALATGIKAIVIENQENYSVSVSVSNVAFSNVSDMDISSYAETIGNYGIAYGEKFEVPNPFLADGRYFSELTISLAGTPAGGGSFAERSGLSIGSVLSSVGTDALPAGDYTLTYNFKDVFGADKSIVYNITVAKKVLAIGVEIPALFVGENTFDSVDLESDVFDSAALASATVKSYYRERGRFSWIELESNKFESESVKWYQFRFVAEYADGSRKIYKEKLIDKFVHKNRYTFDFEEESHAAIDDKLEINSPDGAIPARYLFDGGYFNAGANWNNPVFDVNEDWSVSGDRSVACSVATNGWMGWSVYPAIMNDIGFNAIRFVLNSARAMTSQLSIQESSGNWVYTEKFEVKFGTNEYSIPLENYTEMTDVKSVSFRMLVGDTFMVDDFEFVRVNVLSMSKETYNDTYNASTPYEIKRPTLKSDLYSQTELDAAEWTLSYTLNGGVAKTVTPDGGKYFIDSEGDHGTVVFTWSALVNDSTVTATYTVVIGEICIEIDLPVSSIAGDNIALPAPVAEDSAAMLKSNEIKCRYENGEWQTVSGDVFTPQEAGLYEFEYNAVFDTAEYENIVGTARAYIFVRESDNDIMDFEPVKGSEYNLGESEYMFGTYNSEGNIVRPNYPVEGHLAMDDMYAHSGRYSMRLTVDRHDTGYAKLNYNLHNSGTFDMLHFWAYVENDVSLGITMWVGTWTTNHLKWAETKPFTLKQGWNEVYAEFKTPVAMDNVYTVLMGGKDDNLTIKNTVKYIWFDDFELINVSYASKLPSEGIINTDITLPIATMGDVTAAISYRKKGDEQWTAINNGKFNVAVDGTFEIRYDFGGFREDIFEITIDKFALDINEIYERYKSASVGDTVNLTLPTLAIKVNDVDYKGYVSWMVRYRKDGANDWIALGQGVTSFTVDEKGGYNVEFIASFDIQGDDCAYTVSDYIFVRESDNVMDFELVKGSNYHLGETADLLYNTQPNRFSMDDTYAHSGKYSLRIETINDNYTGYKDIGMTITPKTYKSLAFWVYSEQSVNLTGGEFWVYKDATNYATVNKITTATDLAAGVWTLYVLDFDKPFNNVSSIYSIEFRWKEGDGKVLWFDDFELVPDSPVLPSHAYTGVELSLPAVALSNENAVISYREKGTENWTQVVGNKVTFTKDETYYEIKYAFSSGLNVEDYIYNIYDIYVIDKSKVFMDFEGDDATYLNGKDKDGNTCKGIFYNTTGSVSRYEDETGEHWFAYTAFSNQWEGFKFDENKYMPITSTRYIAVSCYANEDMTVQFWFNLKENASCDTDGHTAKTIKAGYSEVYLDLGTQCTEIKEFAIPVNKVIGKGFRVDNFRVYTPPASN